MKSCGCYEPFPNPIKPLVVRLAEVKDIHQYNLKSPIIPESVSFIGEDAFRWNIQEQQSQNPMSNTFIFNLESDDYDPEEYWLDDL